MASSEQRYSLVDTPVERLMTKQVRTVDESETVIECVRIMKENNIGSLVVSKLESRLAYSLREIW